MKKFIYLTSILIALNLLSFAQGGSNTSNKVTIGGGENTNTETKSNKVFMFETDKATSNKLDLSQATSNTNPNDMPPILAINKIEISNNILRAGESIFIGVSVSNFGQGDAKEVYAIISTNMDYAVDYDKKTFFNIIEKQKGNKTVTIPIKAKENIPTSELQIDIKIVEPKFNVEIEGKRLIVPTESLKNPELKIARFSPKEISSSTPNNQIDINEQIGFDIYIQNMGKGDAKNVSIEIKNSQNGVIFLGYADQNNNVSNTKPYFDKIPSGEYQIVRVQYFINTSFNDKEIKLDIKATESEGKFGISKIQTTTVNSNLETQGEVVVVNTETTTTNTTTIVDLPEESNEMITNLPQNPIKNNRFALIIGNENYKDLIAVDYALNDARAFQVYAEKIFGVSPDHIIYKENAGTTDFDQIINSASNLMRPGRELIVYYSGHGFPNDAGETFLMPVDVNEENVSRFGIKLKDFYDKLSKNNPDRVTIFIDACFSGGGRNGLSIARSGIKLTPKETNINKKIVSFTASTGDQVAQKYDTKQHGLFTYYLLKSLKESKGDITYGEFAQKIQANVEDRSNIEQQLKTQKPKVSIGDGATEWEKWKIK